MTGTLNERHLTRIVLQEQLRSRKLIEKLTRAIGILLLTALILSAGLFITRQLTAFYTVSETTVTVTAGNTLWSIAGEHMGEYPGGIRSYIAEICKRNGIENTDFVAAGTEIKVPIYRYKLS